MSNLTPGPDHAAEYPDAAAGTKFAPTKAIVGAIASGVIAGLGALATGLADGVMTPLEWVLVASATIVGTGITGFGVYQTTNKVVETTSNGGTA